MTNVFDHHDIRLAAVAALVCVVSSFAGITLLDHARKSIGHARYIWLTVAATAVGFGIWATHFVAMISYDPGILIGYDLLRTLLSSFIAIALVGAGLLIVTVGGRRSDAALGGAVGGIGIAAMHYVGISALVLGGSVGWNPWLVSISLILGIVLAALAFYVGAIGNATRWRAGGILLLTAAILSMHFTGMAAMNLQNCSSTISDADGVPNWLPPVVAFASLLILLLALGAAYLDLRDRRRNDAEAGHMRDLANAAVEGLLVVRDGQIVTANLSFQRLVNEIGTVGRSLRDYFSPATYAALVGQPNSALEAELNTRDGGTLSVEIILREVNFGGALHHAIAVRDLSARKKAEQHIRFLAHHDVLTGLPNRASFNRKLNHEISHARRHGQNIAVLHLDLDRLTDVNDLFGHPAGDAQLQRVAQCLLEVMDDISGVARLGGDEFAVLLIGVNSAASVGRTVEGIFDAFRRSNTHVAIDAPISSSIGIALFPQDGTDSEQLMSHANIALSRAKQEGRGNYRFYENAMGVEVRDRRLIEHDLRYAIARGELRLVYQPQVDIQSGDVTGFEVLVRWKHSDRGEISPSMFIPVAEESDLILQIGEWALRTACVEAARWQAPLCIAVNVSAVQVYSQAFAQTVHDVLCETELPPSRLEVEITETALMRDMPNAVNTLKQIRDLGVRIAMDDFGTGYSSLANLRAFPFSKLKIDQSFIRSVDNNAQSAAIVRAVLGLANGLNMPVVAEGVERVEELEFLRAEMCQTAQGYYLSRPEEISHFAALTEGRSRHFNSGRKPDLQVTDAERVLSVATVPTTN